MTRANLRRADLNRADLTRADLTGANLTGANLIRADLTGANLTGAILTGAVLPAGYAGSEPSDPNQDSSSVPRSPRRRGRLLTRAARSLLKKVAGPGMFADFAFDELG